jgi:predicted acetyltransferase
MPGKAGSREWQSPADPPISPGRDGIHMPQLASPSTVVRDSFLTAARDLRDEGWLPAFPVDEVAADFTGYVQRVLDEKESWGVPISTLWYVAGPVYLGTVIIRHRLTPELTEHGGHIGYHVAPRHRRQGHATAMLAAAIGYCRDPLGIARILVTCDEFNTGSRRVIEANGGMLENVLNGECRYWISPGGCRGARPLS